MKYFFMKSSLVVFCLLFNMSNPALYASNPFSDDDVDINESINTSDSTGVIYNIPSSNEDEKQTEDGFPCEGTINCRYGQHCRLGPWGDIIAIIPPGTKVTITGKEGVWYTIEYNGQKCYLHCSLVDTPTTPAYDGYHPYAYADVNPNYKKTGSNNSSSSNSSKKVTTKSNKNNSNNTSNTITSDKKIDTSKSINGPNVPECLMKGLEKAKDSVWNKTNNKCLQFAGTIAEEAGAKVSKKGDGSQPQIAWAKTKDTSLRGHKIADLKEAALSGKLLPGMLIHVKVHYNEDPDYARSTDGHHWFMYMGLVDGEPMFVDNIKENKLRNTEAQAKTFNSSKYGPRSITAIYDPFADQR